ncbi:MAG TPA: zinc-ribbon domain-containing protein, partial [Burkholderiaceae bacterium]|nr:zinc-ribbon domain-containing protein [Burkholderiaceae bacterium]
MKIFRCDHCGHPVFFENVQCLQCGSALAFLPDRMLLAAVKAAPGSEDLWELRSDKSDGTDYRMCHNHTVYQACNFAVQADDPNPLCVSCRQTRLLPDLSVADNLAHWCRV